MRFATTARFADAMSPGANLPRGCQDDLDYADGSRRISSSDYLFSCGNWSCTTNPEICIDPAASTARVFREVAKMVLLHIGDADCSDSRYPHPDQLVSCEANDDIFEDQRTFDICFLWKLVLNSLLCLCSRHVRALHFTQCAFVVFMGSLFCESWFCWDILSCLCAVTTNVATPMPCQLVSKFGRAHQQRLYSAWGTPD